MKLIEPKAERIYQYDGVNGILEHIDIVAGICYNRTKLTGNSRKFVENLIAKDEMRPLEFGTMYLKIIITDTNSHEMQMLYKDDPKVQAMQKWMKVAESKFSITKRIGFGGNDILHVTTNLRVFIESGFTLDDLKTKKKNNQMTEYTFGKGKNKWGFSVWLEDWINSPTNYVERATVKWTCSRAVADEFRTHVSLSSMMKSTRYVKEKEMPVCKPYWYNEDDVTAKTYIEGMKQAEQTYQKLLEGGLKPQAARGALPLDLCVNLIQCGTCNQENTGWERFFKMRISETAHPDAQSLALQWKNILNKLSLCE